jgi:hypothetical protein
VSKVLKNCPPGLTYWKDIRPKFRDVPDIRDMKRHGIKLDDPNDVVNRADDIYSRLEDGSMPCDNPWPQDWIDTFGCWIQTGKAIGTKP